MAASRNPGSLGAVQSIALANGDTANIPLVSLVDASGNIASGSAPSTARLLSAAASDNATNVAAVPTTVRGIQGYNARASAVYLKLYNKATAPSQADTPRKTIYLPASAAFSLDFNGGLYFATGLGYRLTTGGSDADTGALTAADILALNIDYI